MKKQPVAETDRKIRRLALELLQADDHQPGEYEVRQTIGLLDRMSGEDRS